MAEHFLELKSLSRRFGGLRVIENLDLAVNKGEILGVLGPNGAGKSTLFNLIAGVISPNSGTIHYLGQDITRMKPWHRRRLGIGRTYQIPKPFARMSVFENVLVAAVHGGGLPLPEARREAEATLALTGLADRAVLPAGQLSLLDLKRLELAVALANRPRLLLMDEPTAGMAPRERIELMRLTARIAREQSIGVLFTEHDMDVVFEHADRILVLNRGTVIAEGSPEQVRRNGEVRAIYLGEGLVYDARHRGGAPS